MFNKKTKTISFVLFNVFFSPSHRYTWKKESNKNKGCWLLLLMSLTTNIFHLFIHSLQYCIRTYVRTYQIQKKLAHKANPWIQMKWEKCKHKERKKATKRKQKHEKNGCKSKMWTQKNDVQEAREMDMSIVSIKYRWSKKANIYCE